MNKNNASSLVMVVCLLAAPWVSAIAEEQLAVGRASVVDGDTLDLHGLRVRLASVDAPESRQSCWRDGREWPCGRRSALALADLIGARQVSCRWREHDRYRRAVARCEVAGTDLGGWMVERGWALAYRRYGLRYVAQEQRARAARRGLWAGWFVPPWALRHGNGRAVSAESYAGT
jgi:endonuclease YncB( thermonuclease family)